jgi:hypothetical protein
MIVEHLIADNFGTHNGKYALKVVQALRSQDKSWHGAHYDK